ncbi:MAG: hypothetical protein AVDCRST_MAG19-2770 [uncultured Thermomicrobiales bacterium]|uniref:Mobile element protein n=1 Tax=uncultured Thermomicrobiales bacterium TaxID=1645740 RepID=A0A6J4V9F5_9BACT|nr:MAG: hypothetical protein AVDCRST_MAG19-2770 [uncultured Thermomicrobiales bacterium]
MEPVFDAVRVQRHGGAGRPRERPGQLSADEGYGSERCWRLGRKPVFDKEAHRRRTRVERWVNRLRRWRGVASRFEKRVANL